MVQYSDATNDDNMGGSMVGGSAVGGALDMLSQYEANTEGDEYSANNPSDKYLEMLKKNIKGGNLTKLSNAGKMNNRDVADIVGSLSNCEHHILTENAKAMGGGAFSDIAKSKSPSHLMSMVMNDHRMKKEEGGSAIGGSFLDDLGKTAKSLAPLLPLIL